MKIKTLEDVLRKAYVERELATYPHGLIKEIRKLCRACIIRNCKPFQNADLRAGDLSARNMIVSKMAKRGLL